MEQSMNSLPDDPKVLREAIELLGEEVDAERTERELLEGKLVEFAEIMGKFETFSSTVEVQTKRLQEEVKVVTQERDGLALRLSEFSQQSSSPDTGLRELLLQYELEQEQMQGELARVKAETEKRRRTIESLESERDLIQRELAVKEVDEIKGLQQQVESLQARLQKSSKSLEEKERELKNVLRDSDVEGLREQVRKLKADLQQTRTYADEQKKENEDKVDNLRQVKQDSLKDNLVLRELSHNSKIDGLTGQVERLDAELQRMTDLYNASQSENEFMKGDICRLEKDLASLHEVRLELEAARAKAEITKREHEADKVLLDELEEELATLREKEIPLLVKNHKESVEAFDGEIEHSKETSRLAEQRAIELERLLRDLKEESSTARVKLISDHERTVAEASAEVEAMRAKSEISEKRAAELERMMQDLSEKYIQSREEQAARHKQELEWIAVELRQEREKSGMAESKASQLEQTVHIMAKESSLIRAKLDDKIQQLKENERERIRLGKQAQEARELLHAERSKAASAGPTLESLRMQVAVKNEAVEATKGQMAHLSNKVKALEQTLSRVSRELEHAGVKENSELDARVRGVVVALKRERCLRKAAAVKEQREFTCINQRNEILQSRLEHAVEDLYSHRDCSPFCLY